MNQQIEKLFDQALAEFKAENKYFVEKFAELIVRECIEHFAAEPDKPFYGRHVANQIKQHFGVKS
jgi:hypothetical protein